MLKTKLVEGSMWMIKFFYLIFIFISSNTFAQNVGVGLSNPLDKLHVNGITRTSGLRLPGTGAIETGFGLSGKEVNAGKIGYGLFTPNTLDIIGGGTDGIGSPALPRKIRFWAEGGSKFEGPINVTNINTFTGVATDNININANSNISGFTKLGEQSLPIKTITFSATLDKYQDLLGSWATASIPISIDVRKIISHSAITISDINGFIWTSGPAGYGLHDSGKFNYQITNGNIYAKYANCDFCDYPSKIFVHITYTDVDVF